jgi:hypothetical protein
MGLAGTPADRRGPRSMVFGMSDDELRNAARHNLKARNDFKVMLAIFAVITVLLIAIWYFSTGGTGYFWPVWPIIGFVIAAGFAGLDAYGITRRQITEADVDAEIARMNAKRAASGPGAGGADAGGTSQT